jgi:hypothetical protein
MKLLDLFLTDFRITLQILDFVLPAIKAEWSFVSPLLAKPKETISLPSICWSVCHSALSFPDFSLQLMKIINRNLIYDYISMSYRPSLSFVTLDQLLTELFPWYSHLLFRTFFLPWMKWGILKFCIWLPLK